MKIRRWIENVLLAAGLAGLGLWIWVYAGGAAWQDWENWVFDREIRGAPATAGGYLTAKWEQISGAVQARLGILQSPARQFPASSTRPHSVNHNDLIGRLTIPRLQLSAIVREGAGESTLGLALGHIPSTALPGQKGNVGVAGHRDMLFRGLRDIRTNDLIRFETLTGTYVYQVASTEIVKPQDVSVLKAGRDSELTLVTCYPFFYIGAAPDRFIVKAHEVSHGLAEPSVFEARQEIRHAPAPREADPGKVRFSVNKNHSRQLAPGISLGVTDTDVTRRSVNGWMWLMPDRRTVWLRDQSVQEPLVFYGYQDGKRRELVITHVAESSVTGYLRFPDEEGASAPATGR